MMNNVLLGTWRVLSRRLSSTFTLPNANGQQQQSVAASNLSTTHPIRSRPVNSFWSLSIIVIGLLSASSVSAEDIDGLAYTLNSPNSSEATVTGLASGSVATAIDIPDTVIFDSRRYSVTSIGDRAFKTKELISVTIAEGVINIGRSAFTENKLTSIIIPSSATDIEAYAFSDNTLTSVTLPSNATRIWEGAFNKNRTLTSITIPDSVTSIEAYAFNDTGLTSVTIPKSVTTIAESAFAGSELTSLTLGNSVTSIGESAFQTTDITSLVIPDSVTSIADYAFRFTSELTHLTLGEGLETIGMSAFEQSSISGHLVIPNSVTRIEQSAFEKNDIDTLLLGSGLTFIALDSFSDNNLTAITFLGSNPTSTTAFNSRAFRGNAGLDSIDACNDGTGWNGKVFSNGTNDIEVVAGCNFTVDVDDLNYDLNFPKDGEATLTGFASGKTSTTIVIGDIITRKGRDYKVTLVKDNAFEDSDITNVSIPNSVLYIGANTFSIDSLTSVDFRGDRNSSFSTRPFSSYENLSYVNVCSDKANWNNVTFNNGKSDIAVTVVNCTFKYSYNSATSEAEIKGFSDDYRDGIVASETLVMPDEVSRNGTTYSVTKIGGLHQNALTSVTIGKNVETIASYALAENQLTSVTIPASVKSIESIAFIVNKLTSVMFLGDNPGSNSIRSDSFSNNPDLTTINACEGSEGWDGIIFNNSTSDIAVALVSCDISVDGLSYEVVEAQNAFEYYEQNLASAIQDCVGCHSGSQGTLGALKSNANQTNYTAFSEYIAAGNGERLLSKVRGVSHSGGEQFALGSNEYIALSEFLELETNNTASATVLGRSSDSENTVIDIPDNVTLNGVTYPVTSVAPNAFKNAPITAVTIGSNVTSIGFVAFCGSPELTSVTIPGQMVSIGSNAFCGLESVKFMGDYSTGFTPDAFEYDFKLTPSFTVEACFDSPSWDGVSFQAGRENVMVTLCADVYISRISNAAESGDTSNLTIDDLTAIVDLKNIEPDNIDAYLAAISAGDGEDLDTLTEIQTLVNEVNNKDNSNDSAPGLPLWLFKVAKDAEAARVNP
jgi:hypothetical protein